MINIGEKYIERDRRTREDRTPIPAEVTGVFTPTTGQDEAGFVLLKRAYANGSKRYTEVRLDSFKRRYRKID